ncbi:hypothetical protein CK203_107064 [Vitis vinifera]|uniref:GDPGP1-like C-terminal domain-containing protein n=1 Tax=Vitis vinifera TaxID=29760 RepID=A0A438CXB6_VITVI|nr:hypothetical protein CK203_107064 [Vitis vinifera]
MPVVTLWDNGLDASIGKFPCPFELECSGHFVFKSRNDFDQVTEEAMLERMGTASLDEPGFR